MTLVLQTLVSRFLILNFLILSLSLFLAIRYRTFFRPRYKIGYKTITEIAWKCCPGLVGEGCHHDNPTSQPGIPSQHLSPKMPPTQKMFPGPRAPPHPKIPVDSFPIPKKNNYGEDPNLTLSHQGS